jgi:hypothetical protein
MEIFPPNIYQNHWRRLHSVKYIAARSKTGILIHRARLLCAVCFLVEETSIIFGSIRYEFYKHFLWGRIVSSGIIVFNSRKECNVHT